MSNIYTKAPIPLPPPFVSIADPQDGLLKAADLNSPVPVGVRVWEAAEPQYYFQLMLDGQLIGDVKTITEADKVGDIINVCLDEKLLASDGSYQLSYMASSPFSDSHMPSPSFTLKIDRTPPGAALLAPIIFPTASFGDNLTGLLPGYAGMEPGDVIQTVCNGTPGPAHTVQPDELTIRPIEVAFARAFLQTLAAENVAVEYFVTDRAGNASVMSLPKRVSVKM